MANVQTQPMVVSPLANAQEKKMNGGMLPNNTNLYTNCNMRWNRTRTVGERRFLLPCISIPLKCGPQAPTVAFGVACKLCTGRPGDVVHPLPSRKVTAATTQQWSLREKTIGNQPCSSVQLRCHKCLAVLDRWRMSVQPW